MNLANIDEQREFLKKHLNTINTVVTAYVGARVNLNIVEKTHYGKTYFILEDNHNFAQCCGIMSRAWKEVHIDTFNVFWTEDGCQLVMHFSYEHICGGHNGAEFCRINVEDDFVTIK